LTGDDAWLNFQTLLRDIATYNVSLEEKTPHPVGSLTKLSLPSVNCHHSQISEQSSYKNLNKTIVSKELAMGYTEWFKWQLKSITCLQLPYDEQKYSKFDACTSSEYQPGIQVLF